ALHTVKRVPRWAGVLFELPETRTLNCVSGVLLAGSDVEVRRVAARRVVAMVTAVLFADNLPAQRLAAKLAEQPTVGACLPLTPSLVCVVEDAISGLIAATSPRPA